MSQSFPYEIFPLGDSALTISYGNTISEAVNSEILSRFEMLKENPLQGMIEAVPAYTTLTIFYDVSALRKNIPATGTAYDWIKQKVESFLETPAASQEESTAIIEIPVCYDESFAPDMELVMTKKKISREELIALHTGRTYRVYMIGFLPGFPYMGELDDRIAFPRKTQPRMVEKGSIGIAGKQTGIYSYTSMGGWHIIGRTPVDLFNKNKVDDILLKAGNKVRFISMDKDEFENY
jgi:inhibitor of KinA